MFFFALIIFVASAIGAPIKALDLTISATTPSSTLMLGASSSQSAAVIQFSELLGQRTRVTKLTVLNCLVGGSDGDCTDAGDEWGNDAAVASVTLSYTDSTGVTAAATSYFASGEAIFTGLDLLVPRRSTVMATILMDTNTVGSTGATSGEQFALVAKAFTTTDFSAITSRGLSLTGRNVRAVAEGNIMTLAKTKPIISLASGSPSGSGIPGLDEVLRFNIAADSRGYVTAEELLFAVEATDLAGSGWNSLASLGQDSKWSLYNTADLSDALEIDIDFYGTTELEYVAISFYDEVPAGAANTYTLYADTTGASAANNDTIYIDIPDQDEADTLGLDTIVWTDDSTGVYYDGELVNSLPLYGGTTTY